MRSLQRLAVVLILSPAIDAAADAPCVGCAQSPAVAIGATYTGEIWSQQRGGVAAGERYLDNLDLLVDVDGERLLGAEGLRFFGYALYDNGHGVCELTGSAQCVSNIEASRALRLYELWTEWQLGEGGQSLRVGLYDLNSEFDSIETASLFISPSHGIGPDLSQTGQQGPSIFPVTSLGVRASKSLGAWTIQAAALDAVPGSPQHPDRTVIKVSKQEGALLIGEANYHFESGARVGGGYWRYTADFDDLNAIDALGNAGRRDDNAGAYFIVESPTLLAHATDRKLNLFFRAGEAQERINPIGTYLGAGTVYSFSSSQQRAHQLGFAVAIARLGAPYRRAMRDIEVATMSDERSYEVTYRVAVTEWLALQSDLQYIQHPGMDPQLDPSWTVGLRFEVSRTWGW